MPGIRQLQIKGDLELKWNSLSAKSILLLIGCVMLLLTACSSGNNAAQSQPPSGSAETPEAGGEKSADVDAEGKYTPEITIKMGRSTDDVIETTLSQMNNETIGDNRWLSLYKEKLGINIKYDWVVKGLDGYATKLNLSISSRQLPDIFSVNPLQLSQLAAAGVIEDLTDVYDKYAADLTKRTLDKAGADVFKPSTVNGKLMGLPNTIDPSVDAPMMWIRKDWLDNLGLKVPTTMEELDVVIEKFANDDPDRNGQNDTYGFSTYKGLWGAIAGLDGYFASFGSYPRIWQEDANGNLVYGGVAPEAKTALAKMREYYEKGFMPIDFGVYDGGAITELITSGKVGVQFGSHWNSVYPLNLSKEKDAKADWIAVTIPTATGQPAKSIFTTAASSWYVVKKGFKNPEALVKVFNTFIETNWGETQQWGKYYLDGSIEGVWKLSPIFPSVTDQNITDFKQLEEARKSGDYGKLGDSAKGIQAMIDNNNWGWNAVYGSGGSMGVLAQYADDEQYVTDKFTGAPTPTMVAKLNTLVQMQNETYAKIIMGAAPLSDFDKFVESFNKAGGEKMTQEVNDWYKSNK